MAIEPVPQSAQPAQAPERSRWFPLLAMGTMMSILYVVSIGPAVMFVERTGAGEEVVGALYAPLAWLYHRTPLKGPMEFYLALWGWKKK